MLNIKDYKYDLPEECIANEPADPRDSSKLLVLDKESGELKSDVFKSITKYLSGDDVLVFNDSKVFPARLLGKKSTGGKCELLLLRNEDNGWVCISKPGLKVGQEVVVAKHNIKVVEEHANGEIVVDLGLEDEWKFILEHGHTPLPPYIKNKKREDYLRDVYQTVYSKDFGSAAAPTAGLHFTDNLLSDIQAKGIETYFVTLHVGIGTFMNLREENIETNTLHSEYYNVDKKTLDNLIKAKKKGKNIVAVGTTTTRTLESVFKDGNPRPGLASTDLFINPPYQFNFVDKMITNFHLPESSLLMLVSAFVSKPNTDNEFVDFDSSHLGKSYKYAIANKYRFFSFGDAMLIK